MQPINPAEQMNEELTTYERLSFEYIEVTPPTREQRISDTRLAILCVRAWIADAKQYIQDRRLGT